MARVFLLCTVFWFCLAGIARPGEVTVGDVRQALISYVDERGPRGVQMEQWDLMRGDALPLPGRIAGVELAPGARWRKATSMRVRIETPSGAVRTLWVNARLRRARTVVVAERNLPIGHRIAPEDVRTEVREGWGNREAFYEEIGQVVGKKIWRPVAKDACIKHWHIREDRGLKRGDTVTIVAQGGGIRVEAPGRLLETAGPGERVRVLNEASGREIYATVVDSRTVSVAF